MSDFRFWVQGYDEVLGEFSVGFNDLMSARAVFHSKKNGVTEHGGHIEFIEISTISHFSKGE